MKRVLVTGGCGFIGSHFVAHCLRETSWKVVVLDGLSYAGDAQRLTGLPEYDPKRLRMLWHDLRAPIGAHLADAIGAVDYLVNIASESHVDRSIADPVNFVHNNVMLALNVLEFARQARPSKLVMVGTDEVFGPAPPGVAFSEWDRQLPSNPYSASKAAQANLAVAYWRTYGVPVILTATCNNFGERQHPEKLVPKAIRLLMDGKAVPIHGGEAAGHWQSGSRVWLHAGAHADALSFLLKHVTPDVFPDSDRPSKFNIAGEVELTNVEVVEAVASALGVEPRVRFVDFHASRPGHDLRYALDGTKLREAGWQGTVIREDFERTVSWYVMHPEWLLRASAGEDG